MIRIDLYIHNFLEPRMQHSLQLTVQRWGNSLAVRIPASLARSAHFSVGQEVELTLSDRGVIVTPIGNKKLSLRQKLSLYDPQIHGGEVMSTSAIGKELI